MAGQLDFLFLRFILLLIKKDNFMKYDMRSHFYEIEGCRNRKERLKAWRLKNKYTQPDLAAFLGVTVLYLREMEGGTVPVQNQTILACRHLSKLNYMPRYPL